MSAELTTLRRIADEFMSKGDFTHYDELVAPDLVDHDVFYGEPQGTYESLRGFIIGLRTALPDLRFTFESGAVSEDRIFARFTASGTMTGPLGEIPPTGKYAEWTEFHEIRVNSQNQMVEHWGAGAEDVMRGMLGLHAQG